MKNSEHEKIREIIQKIPGYEINRFLVAVSANESEKPENDLSKTKSNAATDVENKIKDFPPSCEFIDIGMDKSNE